MTIQDIRKDKHYLSSITEDSVIEFLFTEDNKFFLLKSDYELFEDVSKMPEYIQSDWINSNKTDLNLESLNRHIKNSKSVLDLYSGQMFHEEDRKSIQVIIDKLISIRRDFILNGIL
jgi:hypothetical protein